MTAGLVLADALQIQMIPRLGVVAFEVESEALGVGAKVMGLEMSLVVEQQVVHLPELVLRARAFGGLRRLQRMRMDFFQRKVAKDHADASFEMLQQQLDRG